MVPNPFWSNLKINPSDLDGVLRLDPVSEASEMLAMFTAQSLASRYQSAHNEMRNIDGLQPQEAFDELLKYVFFKERDERGANPVQAVLDLAPPDQRAETARLIRARFISAATTGPAPRKWGTEGLELSDMALLRVHALFASIQLSQSDLDLRASALRQFLTGPVRKGLGIFLTPEAVVKAVVEALAPRPGERILDPACGSGTFLLEAARYIEGQGGEAADLYGIDKNPRMLQLAEFNCAHLPKHRFSRAATDSLLPFGDPSLPDWFAEGAFDVVVANPPFGVSVDAHSIDLSAYLTAVQPARGRRTAKFGSEILFLERCLRVLKPGGRLGIVLPRSVVTNRTLTEARAKLGRLGYVRVIVTLPPETFAATGTQTTTVVLLVEKYGVDEYRQDSIRPCISRVDNVGFDSTGRPRLGSQLTQLGTSLQAALTADKVADGIEHLPALRAEESFSLVDRMLGESRSGTNTSNKAVGDLLSLASTGVTPGRAAYTDTGLFLVKVGNLSGAGIDWTARDRNFVSVSSRGRYERTGRLLRAGDLLLTSSAHASRYIAKKVDVVTSVPTEVGGDAAYVGEVMLLRPQPDVDPFRLLAYLRTPSVVTALQDRVRGQTAHLRPDDVLSLPLDDALWDSPKLHEIADLFRRQAAINDELNQISFKHSELVGDLEQSRAVQIAAE